MPTLQTNGIELYYETTGQGESLLLLHGLGSRGEDWAFQVPAFAQAYRVLTVDLRGHGRSARPPGPYSLPQMAADGIGLLDGLGIESTHVIGLSMGGMIAFQLAVDRPERIRSMVIVNSGPALVARTGAEWLQIRQRLILARLFGPAQTGKFLSKRLFPKPEQADLRDQFIDQWAVNDKKAYLAVIQALVGWSVVDRVQQIGCPVLVISGDRDYTPLSRKQEYTALIPGAKLLVIEDSGHATPVDQPDKFNACVFEFLDKVKYS